MRQKVTDFINGYSIVFADGGVVQIWEGDVIEISRHGRKVVTGKFIKADRIYSLENAELFIDTSKEYCFGIEGVKVKDITGIKVIERGRYGKQA